MFNKEYIKQNILKILKPCFFMGLYCVFFFPLFLKAQDKIHKTDNTIIDVKVSEVSETEIKYKKFSNFNGPTYTINKLDVNMIVYENGEQEIYNQKLVQQKQKIDPQIYLEEYMGVKLEKSTKNNGVKIIDKVKGHRLKKGLSPGEVVIGIFTAYVGFGVMAIAGEFSLRNAVITAFKIGDEDDAKWTKVNNISDLTKAFIKASQDKKSNSVNIVNFKIKKGIGKSIGWVNLKDFDASLIETSLDKARNLLLSGNMNLAIATYSKCIEEDSVNSALLAEDAYALALNGIYDIALLRLDQAWGLKQNKPEVNYYTAQVLSLMGYDDITNSLWKSSEKYTAPEWIALKAPLLLKKYKNKNTNSSIKTKEELIANFKRANELAAQQFYFQSIVLFQNIIKMCPDEYFPYIGYSLSMEKIGAYDQSAQAIEKAIKLIENNPEASKNKQVFEQRLNYIKQQSNLFPLGTTLPGLSQLTNSESFRPQMMAYSGVSLAKSQTLINARLGYFLSKSNNLSFDLGVNKIGENSYSNVGFAIYSRHKSMVSGGGLMMLSGGGVTSLYVKLSVGISALNKKKTSSFDFFIDVNKGLKKNSLTSFSISIGKSIYFGKRK